jgi:hypothetical protein
MLLENKADLIPDFAKTNEDLNNFALKNKFSGCFRTSAKSGLNINEAMDYFINLIVKKFEEKLKVFQERNSHSLVIDRTLMREKYKQNKNNCC